MIPVKVLSVRYIAAASEALLGQIGVSRDYPSLAMITTNCDDATYIALDAATKVADVSVVYAHSLYAGAVNATTPNAGECIGILAARTPGDAASGMQAVLTELSGIGFSDAHGVPYLARTVASAGTFLAAEAGVAVGSAIAYLIAPPLEAMYALDAALKCADTVLCKLYKPPTETNFAGALLSGTLSACEEACDAFADAVRAVAAKPLEETF